MIINEKTDFFKISIYLFIAGIIIINFLDFNIPLTHVKMEGYVDSDMIYPHRLFMDIFIQKNHLFSWYLTPAPYFFPDILLFFSLEMLFFPNVLLIIALFGAMQYLLMLFLVEKICSVLFPQNNSRLLLYFISILALSFLIIPHQGIYWLAIGAVYHFGNFINGLLFILLFALAVNSPESKKIIFFIGLSSFLSAASDLLFIIQYGVPLLILILFVKPSFLVKNHCLVLSGSMVIGLAFKYYCLIHIDIFYISFQPLHYYLQIKALLTQYHSILFKGNEQLANVILGFYIVLFAQLIITKYGKARLQWIAFPNHGLYLLSLFLLISVFFTVLFLATFESSGHMVPRYMLNFYFFPLAFFWLPLTPILRFRIIAILQILLVGIAIILALSSTIKKYKAINWTYYPSLSKCIDSEIHLYNNSHAEKIKYGIASNAQAGVITSYSKERLQLVEMFSDLSPHYWINNPERYRKHYDFAVIAFPAHTILTTPEHILNRKLIEKINGKPILEFSCNKEATILVYGKNKLTVPMVSKKIKPSKTIF